MSWVTSRFPWGHLKSVFTPTGLDRPSTGQDVREMTPHGTRLLMLIDDEPAQRRLVYGIATRAGWRTIFAADSETAIAMLGTQDGMMLDAIVLDHWAPGADQGTLIAEIRKRRPALPILMLTSVTSVSTAVEAMRAGATDFLVKPVAPDRLLGAL